MRSRRSGGRARPAPVVEADPERGQQAAAAHLWATGGMYPEDVISRINPTLWNRSETYPGAAPETLVNDVNSGRNRQRNKSAVGTPLMVAGSDVGTPKDVYNHIMVTGFFGNLDARAFEDAYADLREQAEQQTRTLGAVSNRQYGDLVLGEDDLEKGEVGRRAVGARLRRHPTNAVYPTSLGWLDSAAHDEWRPGDALKHEETWDKYEGPESGEPGGPVTLPMFRRDGLPVSLLVNAQQFYPDKQRMSEGAGMMQVIRRLQEDAPRMGISSLTVQGLDAVGDDYYLGPGLSMYPQSQLLRSFSSLVKGDIGPDGLQYIEDYDRLEQLMTHHDELLGQLQDIHIPVSIPEIGPVDPKRFSRDLYKPQEAARLIARISHMQTLMDHARRTSTGTRLETYIPTEYRQDRALESLRSLTLGAFPGGRRPTAVNSEDARQQLRFGNYNDPAPDYDVYRDALHLEGPDGSISGLMMANSRAVQRGQAGIAKMHPETKLRVDNYFHARIHNAYVQWHQEEFGSLPEGSGRDITYQAVKWHNEKKDDRKAAKEQAAAEEAQREQERLALQEEMKQRQARRDASRQDFEERTSYTAGNLLPDTGVVVISSHHPDGTIHHHAFSQGKANASVRGEKAYRAHINDLRDKDIYNRVHFGDTYKDAMAAAKEYESQVLAAREENEAVEDGAAPAKATRKGRKRSGSKVSAETGEPPKPVWETDPGSLKHAEEAVKFINRSFKTIGNTNAKAVVKTHPTDGPYIHLSGSYSDDMVEQFSKHPLIAPGNFKITRDLSGKEEHKIRQLALGVQAFKPTTLGKQFGRKFAGDQFSPVKIVQPQRPSSAPE